MAKQKKADSAPGASTRETEQTASGQDGHPSAKTLYLIVFLSGAALMALEMAGARLVEPHFGSTIYVWGSIIGVFMLALSLGYWGGGRYSDRSPSIKTLGLILLVASLLVMIIPAIAPSFCVWLKEVVNGDERSMTLIACLVLFAAPSICMGMVSPFAIKLAAKQSSVLGSVAGSLYAVSTLGSIVGTWLVTFVLVEYFGTTVIIYGVGVVLAAVAVYCFFQKGGGFKSVGTALALIGVVGGFMVSDTPLTPGHAMDGQLLEIKESAYHYITVVNGRSQIYPYRKPARLMMFNNLIESGIILDDSRQLPPGPAQTACGYVDLLHLGMVFTGQAPRDMLVVGCGGGVGPRMFKENYPNEVKNIDVVDIDPWVFSLAEKYFDYPFSKQNDVIKSHVLDGRVYVQQQPAEKKWDYIIMDAYSSGGRIPKHLITEEFLTTVRDRQTDDGVMIINVISAFEKPAKGRDFSRLFRSVYKTIEKVWETDKPGGGNLYVFPRNRSGQGENIIMIATKSGIPPFSGRDVERRYRSIKAKYLSHTDLDTVVQRQLLERPDTDDVPLLTDDFCPTDSMVHR